MADRETMKGAAPWRRKPGNTWAPPYGEQPPRRAGNRATSMAADAAPDGHTLLIGSIGPSR